MKFKIKSILFVAFLTIGFQYTALSQDRDSTQVNRTGLCIGFSAGPSLTLIKNEGISSISGVSSKELNSFSGSLDIAYFFNKYFGLSSGISYNSFQTKLNLDTYQNKFNTTDSEKETYERQVFGSYLNEDQKIDFLSVPVCLNIRLPLARAIGFFLQAGVDLSVPINKEYSSNAVFTYKGYYPAYNLLLSDLPDYGFPSNKSTFTSGKLDIKPFNIFGTASAGVDYFINEKIKIALAANYCQSFSNISNYPVPGTFQLSSDVDQMKSFMEGSNKVTARSMGINLSFMYYF